MHLDGAGIGDVIIGVGINVNLTDIPLELQDKATSLCLEAGHSFDRNQVVAEVLERFEKNYRIFEKTCDLSGLKAEYEAILANFERPVRVLEKTISMRALPWELMSKERFWCAGRMGSSPAWIPERSLCGACTSMYEIKACRTGAAVQGGQRIKGEKHVSGKCCALRSQCI